MYKKNIPFLLSFTVVSAYFLCMTQAANTTINGTASVALTPQVVLEKGSDGFLRLFNGKDLNNWIFKIRGYQFNNNFGQNFRVDTFRKILKIRYDRFGGPYNKRFGYLFFKIPLEGNYRLRIKYRFTPTLAVGAPDWAFKNGGVFVFAEDPKGMGFNQKFPVGVEMQILGGNILTKEARASFSACGNGIKMHEAKANGTVLADRCVRSSSPTIFHYSWVIAELIVRDGVVQHRWKNRTWASYANPFYDQSHPKARQLTNYNGGNKRVRKGFLAFQAEGHEMDFKDILMMKL